MANTTHTDGSAGDQGPMVFVLFGATGDLAKRMVLPAFYQLACEGLLPAQWRLVGNGRGDVAHEDFRAHVHDSLTEFATAPEQKQWDAFAALSHISGWSRVCVLAGQEDAFAEQEESGAAVHLAQEELGAGVEAFDWP
jgi:hypothetical protein